MSCTDEDTTCLGCSPHCQPQKNLFGITLRTSIIYDNDDISWFGIPKFLSFHFSRGQKGKSVDGAYVFCVIQGYPGLPEAYMICTFRIPKLLKNLERNENERAAGAVAQWTERETAVIAYFSRPGVRSPPAPSLFSSLFFLFSFRVG